MVITRLQTLQLVVTHMFIGNLVMAQPQHF